MGALGVFFQGKETISQGVQFRFQVEKVERMGEVPGP